MAIQKNTVRDTVRWAKKDGVAGLRYPVLILEPMVGLEPTTCCLRNTMRVAVRKRYSAH
jgi:hypothetical protein